MSEPIIYVDKSEVQDGKLSELRAAIKKLAAFVEANEPRAISYKIYLSEDAGRMTVVQIHPDSASLEFHMTVAGPLFREFKDLVRLSSIDVYGTPSDRLRMQLLAKASMLGSGTLAVHSLEAGFAHFDTDVPSAGIH
jgi:quinol monooxygenase YgiN